AGDHVHAARARHRDDVVAALGEHVDDVVADASGCSRYGDLLLCVPVHSLRSERLRFFVCPVDTPHAADVTGKRLALADPGAIAPLGERLDRTQEVGGSSPPSSIRRTPAVA